MISWPGKLPAGEVRGQMCTGCDWMPTIAELCGAKAPGRPVDGRSMVRVIRDAMALSAHEAFHWAMGNQWAVRQGDWKLLGNLTDPSKKAAIGAEDKLYLVNLAEDAEEMKNLAKANPQRAAELLRLHEQWATDVKG